MMPHPANVRRRIRQLKDYLIPSSDWISYAIIDDITDVFAPLSTSLGEEVDDIEDTILRLHSPGPVIPNNNITNSNNQTSSKKSEAGGAGGEMTSNDNNKKSDLLRRVGDCRKRVMGLYRLLGNKADVIKGFAKRCNEHWEVAPRSEIGLYLGDIQDHIVTMTGNLSHYERYGICYCYLFLRILLCHPSCLFVWHSLRFVRSCFRSLLPIRLSSIRSFITQAAPTSLL